MKTKLDVKYFKNIDDYMYARLKESYKEMYDGRDIETVTIQSKVSVNSYILLVTFKDYTTCLLFEELNVLQYFTRRIRLQTILK